MTTTTPTLIRDLFLHPHPTYTPAAAAGAIGMSVEDVEGWMEVGELEGEATRDGVVLSWAELVSFAMGFWEQEAIEEALGTDVAEAIPELLRLCDLEVRIPRMEVVALEKLAAREGKSVDAVLAAELRDLVSAQSEWLGTVIPGFASALAWPY
ncbi:MAG TPA: hypothetical protein VN380_00600 [Thermoanaerobaculia bacterium]|jgi:hypothetical protein|nr:hypothetical protein [Thermoanaerobaculia bacterium]